MLQNSNSNHHHPHNSNSNSNNTSSTSGTNNNNNNNHHHHHHHNQHHHHYHHHRRDNHHHQYSHHSHQHHDDHRKQNHCEIEKRRRDKMNHYIMELASVIPSFATSHNMITSSTNNNNNDKTNTNNNNINFNNIVSNTISGNNGGQSQKLDKLTVLRMAVQHVKSLRSSLCSFSSFHLRPSFLSSGNLLKNLILQMASQEAQDNLFMVVTCDRGKVLFVSKSSKDILHHEQDELVGQCLFDILHKDDVSKVKEQISYFSLMPKQMLIDSKTLQPIKNNQGQSFAQLQNQANSTPQPGARRSFFCRMKSGVSSSGDNGNNSGGGAAAAAAAMSSERISEVETSQQVGEDKIISDSGGGGGPDGGKGAGKNKRSSERASDEDDKLSNKLRHSHKTMDGRNVVGLEKTNNKSRQPNKKSDKNESHGIIKGKTSSTSSSKQSKTSMDNSSTRTKDIVNSRPTSSSDNVRNDSQINRLNDNGNNNNKKKDSTNRQRNNGNTSGGGSSTSGASDEMNDEANYMIASEDSDEQRDTTDITGDDDDDEQGDEGDEDEDDDEDGDVTKRATSRKSSSSAKKLNNDNNKADGKYAKSSSPRGSGSGASSTGIESKDSPFSSSRPSSSSPPPPTKSSSSSSTTSSSSSSRKKHRRYVVMHCTGYLKPITLRNDEYDDDSYYSDNEEGDNEDSGQCRTINCLVAVFRRSVMDRDLKPDRPLTFTCRYSMEGKFVFVDQRTTIALGYVPQQLLGTSHYAYCHKDSVNTFKECHRRCILNSEAVSSDIYQFKRANGQHLWLQTSLKSFRNPWTKFIDYIVANHTTAEGNDPRYNEGCVPTKFNQDMTGEASQSSSPASAASSSISLPSDDSKKSASPSSSSIGSCYSMDSYASGGSIQALLNHIDNIKSGGKRYSLNFPRKRGERHALGGGGSSCGGSSSGSATKSNEDSGNFSDLQSCSSVSSQNSAISSEFVHLPGGGVTDFVNNASALHVAAGNNNNRNNSPPSRKAIVTSGNKNNQQQQKQQSLASLSNAYYNQAKPQAGYRQLGQNVCNSLVQYQQATSNTTSRQTSAAGPPSAVVAPRPPPPPPPQPPACQQQQQVVVCAPPQQAGSDGDQVDDAYSRVSNDNQQTNALDHNLVGPQMANKDDTSASSNRLAPLRLNRPMIGSIKPNQRPDYQYPYRKSTCKSGSLTTSVSGHSGGSWNSSNGSVYSSGRAGFNSGNVGANTTHGQIQQRQQQQQQQQAAESRDTIKDSTSSRDLSIAREQETTINKLQHNNDIEQQRQQQQTYVMQTTRIDSIQAQMPMQSLQTPDSYCGDAYPDDLMQPVVGNYMTTGSNGAGAATTDVCQVYPATGVDMDQMMQMATTNDMQTNVTVSMGQQQQQQQQRQQNQQQQQQNQIQGHNTNAIIWNATAVQTNNSANMYHNVNMLMGQETELHQQVDICHRRPNTIGLQTMANQSACGNQMIGQHHHHAHPHSHHHHHHHNQHHHQPQQQQHHHHHHQQQQQQQHQQELHQHHQHQHQQAMQCPNCSNHKCCSTTSNQSYMMANNGDEMNSTNLTSLAVDGDLDEVELLECLAVCEPPDNQLYNIHNNSYQHYNM